MTYRQQRVEIHPESPEEAPHLVGKRGFAVRRVSGPQREPKWCVTVDGMTGTLNLPERWLRHVEVPEQRASGE